jgi:bifunctional non-homologous end joining protein LigD
MVTVTHPERVVFPESGHTKGEVVEWYRRAAPRILGHAGGRPLSLKRFPRGVGGQGFFQKNAAAHYPAFIERVDIPKKGGVTQHPVVRDAEGIVYLANQNVLELHVPTVRTEHLLAPDRLVVDLDPPAGEVDLVRRAARIVGDELSALGLKTVPMATGSKGFHVVAPVAPTAGLDETALAMHRLGTLLAHRHPDELTIVFRVAKRGRRVFVDFLRNFHGATAVAPWSLRARARPTVAMPLSWDELDRVQPDSFVLPRGDAEGAAGEGGGDDALSPVARLARPDPLLELAERRQDPAPFLQAVERAFVDEGLELVTFDRFRD